MTNGRVEVITSVERRRRWSCCWAHGRRKLFELADVTSKAGGKLAVIAPLAFEAVKRIDAIFDIEREINGRSIDERLAMRRERVAPLVSELETWMREERAKLSRERRRPGETMAGTLQ